MTNNLLLSPRRLSATVAMGAAAIGLLGSVAGASSMPRSLAFRTELEIEAVGGGEGDGGEGEDSHDGDEAHSGVLRVRGEFRADRATITVTGERVPASESGEYRLVLHAGLDEIEAARFEPDADGRVRYKAAMACEGEDGCGDLRPFALELDSLAVLDDGLAVADGLVSCPVKVQNRGRLVLGSGRDKKLVGVTGGTRRDPDGEGSYEYKVSFAGLAAGHYELVLRGEGGDLPLEFSAQAGRRTVTVRFRGGESIVEMAALFDTMALVQVVEDSPTELASGPLDCRQ